MRINVTSLLATFLVSMVAVSASAQPFVSDDFSCPGLDAAWTFVNPLNDGSYGLVGATTGQAYLTLTLPQGTPHDAWGSGGVNETVRMMQTANDVDFKIEVKFNFEPTAGYNDQGILVEQDSGNWIRVDVYNPGSGIKLFVGKTVAGTNSTELNASIAGGTGLYLLLERVGNTWTVSHSADGSTWIFATSFTQAYVVSQVGVYAGNPVSALAFTSEVDWFFEQDLPIVPEDSPDITRCAVATEESTWGHIKALYQNVR